MAPKVPKPLPEVLLQAARLLTKHKQLNQTVADLASRLHAADEENKKLEKAVTAQAEISKHTLAQLSTAQAKDLAAIQAMRATLSEVTKTNDELEAQLTAKNDELEALKTKLAALDRAPSRRLAQHITFSESSTESEELNERSEDALETSPNRPAANHSTVLDVTCTQLHRFNDQLSYDIPTQLQPVFYKPFLSIAELEAMRKANVKACQSPQPESSMGEERVTSGIPASPSLSSLSAPSDRDSPSRQAGQRISLALPAQSKTRPPLQPQPIPRPQSAAFQRQSQRLRGEKPAHDGSMITGQPRKRARAVLGPIVNNAIAMERRATAEGPKRKAARKR